VPPEDEDEDGAAPENNDCGAAGVAAGAGAAEAEMATMCKVAPSFTSADSRVAASFDKTRPEQMTRRVSEAEPVAVSIFFFKSATVMESSVSIG